MAKKKNSEGEEEVSLEYNPEVIRKQIQKDIAKEFGNGIAVTGDEIMDRPQMIIPFSPRIDSIIGGGVPEGSWLILSGKEKIGKSLSALHFCGKCQMPEYGNRNIYFLNVEGRLKKRDITGIPRLQRDKLTVIESTKDKILSTQDYLSTAEKILHSDEGAVLVIDSISQLCEERERTGGMGTETRGGGAKLVSQFTRQMANVVPVKRSIVICIMQLGANTSGYGEKFFEKGGNSVQYQADVKLRAVGKKPWALTEGGNPFGQKVEWECKSAALGPPGRKTESFIRYGEGIDEIAELMEDAKDIGLINAAGAWQTMNFLENHLEELGLEKWDEDIAKSIGAKCQGQHKAREALIENPQWFKWLEQDLKANL